MAPTRTEHKYADIDSAIRDERHRLTALMQDAKQVSGLEEADLVVFRWFPSEGGTAWAVKRKEDGE